MSATIRAWWLAGLVAGAAGLSGAPARAAGTEATVLAFPGGAAGLTPDAQPVFDSAGTQYGTTALGGKTCPSGGCGLLYRLTASGQLGTVYAFTGAGDGYSPMSGYLALAGTTLAGSAQGGTNQAGVLFTVRTDGSHFTVLHELTGLDGYGQIGPLQNAGGGDFYGVTEFGGPAYSAADPTASHGVLFRVRRNGHYQELHHFGGASDGAFPNFVLVDAAGNIFGSTYAGGAGAGCTTRGGCGIVYEFANATRTLTVLHSFTGGADGSAPVLGSIGPDGTLYGATTGITTATPHGTLFSITPSNGHFSFATLATFQLNAVQSVPFTGPTLAPTGGALIGTTSLGTLYNFDHGRVTTWYDFTASSFAQGYKPSTQPAIGPGGAIYGTTLDGGVVCKDSTGATQTQGCGVIYQYTPQ